MSLGILTSDVARGLALAERIPSGIAHINDQTLNDGAHVPFGGVLASGTGSRFGGAAANIDALLSLRRGRWPARCEGGEQGTPSWTAPAPRPDRVSGRFRAHVITAMYSSADERVLATSVTGPC